ncbi:MAG: dihydroneopterin aldolase [Sulfurospirillum sp.]|jgi:dihydroneopterin aldolase|nr:dihydroneopterin aldolase [Sulfurospirillum sp.]MBP9612014.1 dihydroneopterin aldolase [Sulfurospirillum sp.]
MKIHIKDLTFETIVGLLETERVTPQKVSLHVKITYDFDGTHFIDYAQVCALITKEMQIQRYFLLEEALEGIYSKILSNYPYIRKISLKIFKPTILSNALVGVSHTFKVDKN